MATKHFENHWLMHFGYFFFGWLTSFSDLVLCFAFFRIFSVRVKRSALENRRNRTECAGRKTSRVRRRSTPRRLNFMLCNCVPPPSICVCLPLYVYAFCISFVFVLVVDVAFCFCLLTIVKEQTNPRTNPQRAENHNAKCIFVRGFFIFWLLAPRGRAQTRELSIR